MNILITTGIYPPEIGGPATYTALMEKELPKQGIGVVVLPFRIVRHLPRWIRHFIFFCKVLSMGRKVDLLYAQDPLSVGFPTMVASKFLRKPFLVRIAGDYAWEQAVQRFGVKDSIDEFQNNKYGFHTELMRFIQRLTASMADTVINPSKYFCSLVSSWAKSRIKAVPIYNGIDFSEISKNTDGYKPKTIISAGRLLPWKGFDTLIKILPKLPEWELSIAGEGSEMKYLNGLSVSLGVSNRVKFLGSISRKDLLEKIQKSEVFVLNTSFESFSFQVVEAMCCETPVITTKIGNLAEIIDDGKEGLLIEPNNEAGIIYSIEKIYSDKDFRGMIVKNALEKAKKFSLESTVKQTSQIIIGLINSNK